MKLEKQAQGFPEEPAGHQALPWDGNKKGRSMPAWRGSRQRPAKMLMAISVTVPKDLSGIKTKVALNLTKRQIVCFGAAAAIGLPLYLLAKRAAGPQAAVFLMAAAAIPFFLLAMYERDGLPAERYLQLMIRQRLLVPGIRRYESENLYRRLEEMEEKRKEAAELEAKACKRKQRAARPAKNR